MKTIRLTIKGKVQGVFYRASARDMALELGVSGWVRNLPDGNVEITATAAGETLQQFIRWCRQGPPRAVVDEVITVETEFQSFDGFRIIR